jgi:predicted nucleotidyltransferase
MRQLNLIRKLNAFFSNQKKIPFIKLAYLFGSHTSGKVGPISDYDIAVLCSKSQPYKIRYELKHELATILLTDRLDLVVLNYAPIELQYAVVATGTVIYEVNVEERVEYEAITLSLYGDYLPFLRNQRQAILEGGHNEAGIQRYREALGKTQRLLEEIRTL